VSKSLGVISNCDHVLKQNTKSSKIYAFGNFDIYSRMINTYHMACWRNCKLNNKLQTISFEKKIMNFIYLLVKGPQKDNSL
jgi:hypothetical protein